MMQKLNNFLLENKINLYSFLVSIIFSIPILITNFEKQNISQRNQVIIGIIIGVSILISFRKNHRGSLLLAFTLVYILFKNGLL
jgi:hypothetical protein